MVKQYFASILSFTLVLAVFQISEGYGEVLIQQDNIKQLIVKCGGYCELVKGAALNYICNENITDVETTFNTASTKVRDPYGNLTSMMQATKLKPKRTKKKTYVYDYQLIKKGEELKESRILLKENNRKKHKENAELQNRYKAQFIIFGPVGFLSRYWQHQFNFEKINNEQVNGIDAVVVKATPKPTNTENRSEAIIWINPEDASVLRISWQPESMEGFEAEEVKFRAEDLTRTLTWDITYGFEKNGVRFPSIQHIQDMIVNETGDKYILQEITINYSEYKFFTVEVGIKDE
jgi:hypothetical protein